MDDDEPPHRPAQEPSDGRPEHSVATPLVVWVMMADLTVAAFAVGALLLGGRLS